jgi:putative peptidoglycan binding protein/L,D-transpeptidase-like protein
MTLRNGGEGIMKRLHMVCVIALASLALAAPSAADQSATGASSDSVGAAAVVTAPTQPRTAFDPRARFAREFTRRGDADTSVRHIEHVRELQYRLQWAGVYSGPVTGYFGKLTQRAVKRFQDQQDLRVTGHANFETWEALIPLTIRDRSAIPARCKLSNVSHACYDRQHHQVTLWKRGTLWNSWLVRGGSSSNRTRLGHFHVYYRDKDHVSSLYDSPMPYSQFFDRGEALHGSVLMMDPFVDHSHGCVNMYIEDALQLWKLTSTHPLKVDVYGAWD